MWGLWAAGGGWQAGVSHVVVPILAGTCAVVFLGLYSKAGS